MRTLACACAVLLLAAHAANAITFANGELNVIDHNSYMGQHVAVRDGPGGTSTTVRIVDRGVVQSFHGQENSIIEVFGGLIYQGGVVSDSASLTITDGDIEGTVEVYSSQGAFVSGGRIHESLFASGSFSATGSSYLNFSGGRVGNMLSAGSNAVIDWTGGVVFGSVTANDFGVVNIFGSDFELNGVPVPLGPLALTGNGIERLTGRLASCEVIDNKLVLYSETASIVLVPEPSVVALLGLGLVGLALRRRGAA